MKSIVSILIALNLVDSLSPDMSKLEDLLAECEDKCMSRRVYDCTPRSSLELENIGSVMIGGEIAKGMFGKLYQVQNHEIVIKVATKKFTLCKERAIMEFLDGLDGHAPKVIGIIDGVKHKCEDRTIAMELVGDADFDTVVDTIDSNFYARFARLIEVLRVLHDRGLAHGDLHGGNVRVKSNDPSFVALIDFAAANPWEDPQIGSRRWDTSGLVAMVTSLHGTDLAWFQEFKLDMDAIDDTERPRYEKWIEFFDKKSDL